MMILRIYICVFTIEFILRAVNIACDELCSEEELRKLKENIKGRKTRLYKG